MYKQWLNLLCKWNTVGLTNPEFREWDRLSTKLNKHCPDCEGETQCKTCGNVGLVLNLNEKLVLHNLDKAAADMLTYN